MDTAAASCAKLHDQHQPIDMVLPSNRTFDADNSGKKDDAGVLSSSGPSCTPFNTKSTSNSSPSLTSQQKQEQKQEQQQYRHPKMSRRISITQTPSTPPSATKSTANNSAAHVLLDWLQGSFDNHRQLMSESDSGLLLDNCHPWMHINIKPIVLGAARKKTSKMSMPPMSYIEYADNNPLHMTRTQLLMFSPVASDAKTKQPKQKRPQPICMQMFDVETIELEQLAVKLKQQQDQPIKAGKSALLQHRAASLDFECGREESDSPDGHEEQNTEILALMAKAKQVTTIIWHAYEKQDKFLGFIQKDAATSCSRRPSFVSLGVRSKSVTHDNNSACSPTLSNGTRDDEADDGFSDDAGNSSAQPKSSWMSLSSCFPLQNKHHYSNAASSSEDVLLSEIMNAKEEGMTPDLILSLNELFIANSHIISRFQAPSDDGNNSDGCLPGSTAQLGGFSHQHISRPFLSDCLIPFFHFRRCSLYSGSIEMSEDKSALDAVPDADKLSIKQTILHDQGDRATLVGSKTGVKYQVELAVVPWLDRDGLRIAVYEADNDMPCAMTVTAESQFIQLSLSWLNIRFAYCDDYIEMFSNSTSTHDEAFEPQQPDENDVQMPSISARSDVAQTPVTPTTAAAVV